MKKKRKNIYTKSPSNLNNITDIKSSHNKEGSIEELMNAFYHFLERIDKEKPINTKITTKEYSVEKRKDNIISLLNSKALKKAKFTELFDIKNKSYIITTFISILELSFESNINIIQEYNFSDIYIELRQKKEV